MNVLLSALRGLSEIRDIIAKRNEKHFPAEIAGLSGVHKAQIFSALSEGLHKRAVLICADELAAKRMSSDIGFFLGKTPVLLPSRDFMFSRTSTVSREWEQKRISALYAFSNGMSDLMIASVSAVMSRTMPPDIMRQSSFELKAGMSIRPEGISLRLISAGYSKCTVTEGAGQFSVRGGIFDIFSPFYENPVRIEFFGDEIDTISFFDRQTQRRLEPVEGITVVPARETVCRGEKESIKAVRDRLIKASNASEKEGHKTLAQTLKADAEAFEQSFGALQTDYFMPFVYDTLSCAADYFDDALVFIDDLEQVKDAACTFEWRINEDIKSLVASETMYGKNAVFYRGYSALLSSLNRENLVIMNTFFAGSRDIDIKGLFQIAAKQLPSYGANLDVVLSDIRYYIDNGYKTAVVCGGEFRAKSMFKLLEENGIRVVMPENPAELKPKEVLVISGCLSSGFEYPGIRLAVLTDGQTSPVPKRNAKKQKSGHERVRSCADLSPGDIVVHDLHGIGRFVGIERMSAGGAERDYIKIAFQGTDVLYVPATSLDVISKYIGGGEDTKIKLNKLGGTEWKKQKARAKAAAQDMAKKLVLLYAERSKKQGFQFEPDDDSQAAFEESFEYDETDDQLRSALEIKADMESRIPMDRLLCGDVGYGKTEVALRAVMKCVLSGKQAAILAPTTVLARQHYLTALKRFSGTGVNVDVITRFKTSAGLKKTLSEIKSGKTDLLIGTHRILQKDVKFKDLGLLVIDEEQRFGVAHKEAIKEITKNIDVLTLSATPIPRTLGMALSGIRDMSVLEEAPKGRMPVTTYVIEYSTAVIIEAIKRELSRDGQVYYVHNRTESIDAVAARLQVQLPDAVIATAHGKMSEEQLTDVMQRLSDGEIQILVCTTIIETGVDVPNVNTLIIEDAENFGLSQLHQLRGRVGRSSRRGFAYFTYRPGKALTEVSQKRLAAIREFAEFGAGFKIAMRDMEIRGAGNVLGAEQSGHMVSVGYDMYLRLLEEAVSEEKGETPAAQPSECTVDFKISANLPDKYIPDERERIDFYRRIAMIRNDEDLGELLDELIDRYGEPPESTLSLLSIALIRSVAARTGICEISHKADRVEFRFNDVSIKAVSELCSTVEYSGRVMLSMGARPYVTLRLKKGEDVLKEVKEICEIYSQAKAKEKGSVEK